LVHSFNTESREWTRYYPVGTAPAARGYDVAILRGDEMIVSFGGTFTSTYTVTSIYNDIWAYNFRTNTWRLVNAGGSGSNFPSPRLGPAGIYKPESDSYFIFGGISEYFVPLGDTWEYRFATNSWHFINTTSSPSPRYDMLCVYDSLRDAMLIYGGETLSGYSYVIPTDVMWEFSFITKTWNQIIPDPAMPPRNNGNGAVFFNGMMLLTGGDIGGGVACGNVSFDQNIVNETWSYNSLTHGFTQLCPRHTIVPLKRATTVLVEDVIYVFGGWSFYNALCEGPVFNYDVWAFPPTLLPPGGFPCRRSE